MLGEMCVMDVTGDTKSTWNPDNPDEVEMARDTFNKMKKKGYIAYKVSPDDGSKAEIMTTFDPSAGKIILAPPLKGG